MPTGHYRFRRSLGNVSSNFRGARPDTYPLEATLTYVFNDEFTDSNGTLLTAHTPSPVNTTGNPSWEFLSNTADIQGNKASPIIVAGSSRSVIDSGLSDNITIEADVKFGSNNGLIFRTTDDNNTYWAIFTTNTLHIYKREGGSISSVASQLTSGLSTGTYYTMRVTLDGDKITVTYNDEFIVSTTQSFNNSATKHGVHMSSTGPISQIKITPHILLTASATSFTNTTATVVENDYISTSVGAKWTIQTDASYLFADTYTNYDQSSIANSTIGYRINGGSWRKFGADATDSEARKKISLGSGTNTIQFSNGSQRKPASTIQGGWMKRVWLSSDATTTTEVNKGVNLSNQMVIYGDSITAGGNARNRPYGGYAQVLDDAMTDPVTVEAWGFRTLFDDCETAGDIDTFVAKIAAVSPTRVWLAIGTNDYGLESQSAADFETMYAALLADLVVALPSAEIFCASPIHRTDESANSFGDTLGDYRTAISNAVTTTADVDVTYVDTSSWLDSDDLDDGIHPTTAGHVIMATNVQSEIGL